MTVGGAESRWPNYSLYAKLVFYLAARVHRAEIKRRRPRTGARGGSWWRLHEYALSEAGGLSVPLQPDAGQLRMNPYYVRAVEPFGARFSCCRRRFKITFVRPLKPAWILHGLVSDEVA